MPRIRHTATVLPALLAVLLTACSAPATSSRPATTGTPAASAVASSIPPEAPLTTKPPATTATSWVMPDLVDENLQAAQDAIQALTANGVFVTTSHDATGAGRTQVLDRNWKVCSQSVRPGAKITTDSKIDFGTVKLTEAC